MGLERAVGGLMALALVVTAAPAQAALGNGIRVGGAEGRLHPFMELELRYDSNVAALYGPNQSIGDLILHLRPGLQLTVPGDTVAVEMRATLDWSQYFGIDDPVSKDLSRLYASVSLGVGFNRSGQVGLELDEQFSRSNQPASYSVANGVVSNYNDVSLSVPWRPGGGALTVTLAGDWTIESFEPYKQGQFCDPALGNPFCDPAYLSDLGYNNFGAGLGLNWKFLPKTAVLLDLSWFTRVPNSTLYSMGVTGMRAQVGATGLVTAHFAATLKAGYGTTLDLSVDPAAVPQPDLTQLGTWLATISAEWLPSTFSTLKLAYRHDLGVDPGLTYSLYTISHVTLDGKSKLNGMLSASITGDLALLSYRDATASNSTILTVKPALQAELSRWLQLELAYQFTNRTTDLASPPPGWEYSKNEIWLRGVGTY
jgi:hypothetical protein